MNIIVSVLIGIAIGWNLPQPAWAKYVQEKVTTWFKGIIQK